MFKSCPEVTYIMSRHKQCHLSLNKFTEQYLQGLPMLPCIFIIHPIKYIFDDSFVVIVKFFEENLTGYTIVLVPVELICVGNQLGAAMYSV